MKKILAYTLFAVVALTLGACQGDKLDEESVIVQTTKEYNDFDRWLQANYVNPYNISFKYRYEEIESDFDYYTVPADYNQAIELAHVVKYICMESYDEVAGVDFTRAYFPKEFYLIGEWEYKNNGSYILGTAEGGKKILLSGVNYFDSYKNSIANLTHYYLKTIHHEFTHILNQTKDLPVDYKFVTGTTYVAEMWNQSPYNSGYLTRGYISAYSQEEYTEDFAEMLSMYICYSPQQWAEWMESAGDEGRELINTKLSLVRSYMQDSWNIDIDKLRNTIQRREADLEAGKINLNDLTIN